MATENKKTAGEMVGGCSVCSDDQGTEENPLVYCDGCEVAVHQACYGIVNVPPGNWFCRKCESSDRHNKIKCELCPLQDGALKKTETGLWAHVVCALYIPEVLFGNNNTMEPIIMKFIKPDRFTKKCYLCEEAGNSSTSTCGAMIECHKLGCKQSFHVTCAQTANLLCEEAGQGSDNVIYCGYCKHHFRKKAGNRKSGNTLNNLNSSYLDSPSDSSQDNDSHSNTTDNDKNLKTNTNKISSLPANLSTNETLPTNPHQPATSSITSSKTTSKLSNNTPISLTIPLTTTSSQSNKTSSTVSATSGGATTPQKKKRAPKSLQGSTNSSSSNSSTLLATTSSLSDTSDAHSSSIVSKTSSSAANKSNDVDNPQDVYSWSNSSGNKEQNEKNATQGNNNKGGKRKQPATPNATQSNTKTTASSNNQSASMTSYNLNKIGSLNLSLSTSPQLASPSNSTKSSSNSSTSSISTTTATSSSSSSTSTSSNSPSPALLSPNVSNRGSGASATTAASAVRLESPLASNSRTGSNMPSRPLPEPAPSNITLPLGQNILHTRINLDNPKNDLKKNPLASSSLLSTAVPNENPATQIAVSSSMSGETTDSVAHSAQSNLTSTLPVTTTVGSSAKDLATSHHQEQTNSTPNTNTQPTMPSLVIPASQLSANSSSSSLPVKPAAKPRAAAKSSRKKPTEANEVTKPEPKPKANRSKKAITNTNETEKTPKVEPKRGKGKQAGPKVAEPQGSTTNSLTATKTPTATPTKRKSRSASLESNPAPSAPAPGPTPAKRQRKKKADTVVKPVDQTSSTSSVPPLSISSNSTQLQNSTTSNTLPSAAPLLINTPVVNSRLATGIHSVEGQDTGNRYFSPLPSPYTNYDQLIAPRSSLSRLFTTSANNLNNSPDDPAKAFEELRENTWSHLSRCVLEQAQQFDIPSLIGTLYTLRAENEKLVNKVRDLTMKRDQLIAINARLDLPGPMLTQHLNNTSPNFASLVSGLTNSPKSLPASSPSSAIAKQPLVSVGSYNHVPPGSLGPPSFLDRSSPLVSQTHSGINNMKSSSISTPSPPIGALIAHSNSNRTGLITVNPPYMPNVFQPINTMTQLGSNPQGSSYYPRQ